MKHIKLLVIGFLISSLAVAQEEENASLGEQIDQITYSWDTEAEGLKSYDGLTKFCKDAAYRDNLISLLNEIHHFDSVLYDRALVASQRSSDKEIKKLIKEIEGFEDKYSMKSLIRFMSEECKAQRALDKEQEDLRTEMGEESYDNQVYIIELELRKYVKHVTKRIDNVRKHVHHLHIK
jgi:hypothetical protein